MGASDLKSEMMLVPRSMSFSSDLGDGNTGAAWKNPYGFVGVNAAGLAYATDGMNEAGLTVGALFFPGFAKYQEVKADELATTVSNVDLVNYILSNFKPWMTCARRCRKSGWCATPRSKRSSARPCPCITS
jgi:choloylglycine hydrolase